MKGEGREKYTKETRITGNCSDYMNKSRFEDKKCFCRQKKTFCNDKRVSPRGKCNNQSILNVIGKLDIYFSIIGDFYTPRLAIEKKNQVDQVKRKSG